eukprot:TRINITY_DN897_c0_g1_i11.p12 TRINITY_DN897_c0_g1~~TRINITY_DN897_c0_g1_i11.p12  ORF type:complete len:118 (+),score=2.63 TRINITY_DN897_c0_g1_i11:2354-2707(+)
MHRQSELFEDFQFGEPKFSTFHPQQLLGGINQMQLTMVCKVVSCAQYFLFVFKNQKQISPTISKGFFFSFFKPILVSFFYLLVILLSICIFIQFCFPFVLVSLFVVSGQFIDCLDLT